MANPVVHWEIAARDPRRAMAFYSTLFDWQIDAGNPLGYGFVDTGEGGIEGGIDSTDGPPRVTFYVQVPDLEATLRSVVNLGGRIVTPPTAIPGVVTMAMFADPEGNVIGLVKG